MTRIDLVEHQPLDGVPLTAGQLSALTDSDLVSMRPSISGTWTLTADKGMAGAVALRGGADAVELRIAPKLPIRRLFFLLGYAQHGPDWRRHRVDAGEHTDLLPALASAFAHMADHALAQGVLMGYRTVEESLPVLRGRIRESEQLRRRFGALLPVEVRYDDYSADTPENQILLAASRRLLRVPDLDALTRSLLHRTVHRLADATPLVPGRPLPRWRSTRLNARYQAPLGLAELVLRGGSYELDDGRALRVDGLVLRMWKIFEDFVTRAVTHALSPHGGRCQTQDRAHHLDHARTVQLEPDLVYYRPGVDGREAPHAVLDAKYKRKKSRGGHNSDLYQMLAYCTALRTGSAHLVYAAGAETEPRTHLLHGKEKITVQQHTLHLDQPPEDVLDQVSTIADQLRS